VDRPHHDTRWVLYALKGTIKPIKELNEAKHLGKIGTYRADAREQYLKARGFTNLVSVTTNRENFRNLLDGVVDMVILTNASVRDFTATMNLEIEKLQEVFVVKQVELYMAFNADSDPDLVARWSDAYDKQRADGAIKRLWQQQWPGTTPPGRVMGK